MAVHLTRSSTFQTAPSTPSLDQYGQSQMMDTMGSSSATLQQQLQQQSSQSSKTVTVDSVSFLIKLFSFYNFDYFSIFLYLKLTYRCFPRKHLHHSLLRFRPVLKSSQTWAATRALAPQTPTCFSRVDKVAQVLSRTISRCHFIMAKGKCVSKSQLKLHRPHLPFHHPSPHRTHCNSSNHCLALPIRGHSITCHQVKAFTHPPLVITNQQLE